MNVKKKMKNLNLNQIDENTPLRTSFYLRTQGEKYTIRHANNNTYYWGNIKLPPINIKTICHLPGYVLQIINTTHNLENWGTLREICSPILTNEICVSKTNYFKWFHFKYKTQFFAIELFQNKILIFTYNNIGKLTPIEQIPTEILKLC